MERETGFCYQRTAEEWLLRCGLLTPSFGSVREPTEIRHRQDSTLAKGGASGSCRSHLTGGWF